MLNKTRTRETEHKRWGRHRPWHAPWRRWGCLLWPTLGQTHPTKWGSLWPRLCHARLARFPRRPCPRQTQTSPESCWQCLSFVYSTVFSTVDWPTRWQTSGTIQTRHQHAPATLNAHAGAVANNIASETRERTRRDKTFTATHGAGTPSHVQSTARRWAPTAVPGAPNTAQRLQCGPAWPWRRRTRWWGTAAAPSAPWG